ncbi:hypothetical protein NFI96_016341 [Prochilodus magdalenae]|nr:hypothetical protein NFI96_016341 [Prochilodus magdalenae]
MDGLRVLLLLLLVPIAVLAGIEVQQRLVVCELSDSDRPGQMITKTAVGGVTEDELRFYKHNVTYQNSFNFTEGRLKIFFSNTQILYENLYYPACIKALRGYLQKRRHQVKRRVKPRVRLIQRRRSVSGWDGVTCLATGFYPRHINLTILRDGQPVPDHLITGGDLLPNGDGTYQMRKHLELSQEELKKQNYTCTVTHLSLDNKLDVHLDLDPGEPIGPILSSVVAALVLVCVVVVVTCMLCRRKRAASSQGESSSTCSSHSLVVISTFIKGDTQFPEFRLTVMLDDITVGYFDFEKNIYVSKGLNEEEEENGVLDLNQAKLISSSIYSDLEDRYLYLKHDLNLTEKIHVQQTLVVCELMDNDQPGQMITKNALGGTTVDQLHYHESKFTYQNHLNISEPRLKPHLQLYLGRHKFLYYPACIRTLRGYLKQRGNQVRRKGMIHFYMFRNLTYWFLVLYQQAVSST